MNGQDVTIPMAVAERLLQLVAIHATSRAEKRALGELSAAIRSARAIRPSQGELLPGDDQ